mgnify:CR=1 FL=1
MKAVLTSVRLERDTDGIPDIDGILRGRHQSHTGLGLGLSGSQKLVDSFDLKTGEGGTLISLGLQLPPGDSARELAASAAAALVDSAQGNPVEELAEQNRALRDSLAEQEFLLRELHHRTKNNLAIIQSLAALQARSAKSPEARQAFANAHSYLYRAENVTEIGLREHVMGLTERLSAALRSNHVRIVCDIDSVPVDFELATELALIINELVTNAAKHAFGAEEGGVIHVEAHQNGHGLHVSVWDEGPGLVDAETVLRDSRSLGWRIVETSTRKLKGTLVVKGDHGLRVDLFVPNGH